MQRHRLKFPVFAETDETIHHPQGNFKHVYFETYDTYDVIWFVWDRDDNVPEFIIEDDWEPIVLHWQNSKLVGVSVRPHFRSVDYYAAGLGIPDKLVFSEPLEVEFLTSNHGALVRTPNDEEFEDNKADLSRLEYEFETIYRWAVPNFARRPWISLRQSPFFLNVGEDIYRRSERFSY